jgi:PAS domain S-box-containing protein
MSVVGNEEMEEDIKTQSNNSEIIFESVPIAMLILDPNREIKKANALSIKKNIINNKEFIGMKFGEAAMCPNAIEAACGSTPNCSKCLIKETIEKVFVTESAINNIETKLYRYEHGSVLGKWYRMHFVPMTIDGGINVMMCMEDITEQKEIEEKLFQSMEYCIKILENFPSMVWRADSNKQLDYANRTWLEFTGMTMGEAKGSGWFKSVHPLDRERYSGIWQEAFNRRVAFEIEHRVQRHDGEYRWCVSRGTPFYDINNEFEGFIGVVFDITERKIAEEGLKRYELLSQNARDIILFIDMEGKIIDANTAAVKAYGYTKEELLNMTVYDFRISPNITYK